MQSQSESLPYRVVVTFFALLVGARIAGLLGIFLAIPIADLLVSLLEIDELKRIVLVHEVNFISQEQTSTADALNLRVFIYGFTTTLLSQPRNLR